MTKSSKISYVVICVLIVNIILGGCSANFFNKKNSKIDVAALTTANIADILKDKVVFRDNMKEIKDDNLDNVYSSLDKNLIYEYSIYISDSGATAEEIAVFKVKNSSDIENIKQAIENRISEQSTNFKDYVPEEMYKLQNAVIKNYENFIIYVASDTPDEASKVLDEILQ